MAIQFIWQLVLYLMNGILVMLQLAFKLDLLEESMGKLAEALAAMKNTIVTPGGLAALAAMSIWGIWNGLIRNKTIDTVRGLIVSLLFMAGLLGVIGDPGETLGTATHAANEASGEVLSSIANAKVGANTRGGVRAVDESIFTMTIKPAFCALQFGDVKYCEKKPSGLNQSIADTWLQAPPQSEWRKSLWEITKAEDEDEALDDVVDPPAKGLGNPAVLAGQPGKVKMIGSGSVMPRAALLLLILVGVLGAIALFCYLAARLLMAALMVLILIMFAPVMFLVAALGEGGRASVVAWLMRLVGAFLTKVIFAFFLAVIVAGSSLIAELEFPFLPTWIVFATFWWSVLLKRKDLLALVSLDPKTATPSGLDYDGAGGGNAHSQFFNARQFAGKGGRTASRVTRGVTRGAIAGPRVVLRGGLGKLRRHKEGKRAGRSDAARQFAREELENEARFMFERRNAAQHQAKLEKGQPSVRRKVTQAQVQNWINGRRSELGRGADAPENLEAAGINPVQHRLSNRATQDVNRAMTQQNMDRHRQLLDRAGVGHSGDEHQAMGRRELKRARKEARIVGRKSEFRKTARERAARHRQGFRNEKRSRRKVR